MKCLREKMKNLRWWAGAALLAAAAGSCGGKQPDSNGETHFLCADDGDCARLGPQYVCKGGTCEPPVSTDVDGSTSDFAGCERPPPSVCSLAQTCQMLGCGGPEFETNGCARASCTGDAQCLAQERCVKLFVNTSYCAPPPEGGCACSGNPIALRGAFCNPITAMGPGGAWQQIDVTRAYGPCPPGSTCVESWTLTPDGHLAISKEGQPSTADLPAFEQDDLALVVDGPELRRDLRDGFACATPVNDLSITVRVVLAGETLEREVTSCVVAAPEGNAAQNLVKMLTKY